MSDLQLSKLLNNIECNTARPDPVQGLIWRCFITTEQADMKLYGGMGLHSTSEVMKLIYADDEVGYKRKQSVVIPILIMLKFLSILGQHLSAAMDKSQRIE